MHSCHRFSSDTLDGLPHVPNGVVWCQRLKFINPEGLGEILLPPSYLDVEGMEQRCQSVSSCVPSHLLAGVDCVSSSFVVFRV